MRIVVTLATFLALSCAVNAGGLYAGDESPDVKVNLNLASGDHNFNITPIVGDLCRCNPPLGGHADCDTSVYHLEHSHAAQLIDRVKSLIGQISAYATEEDVAALPKSVILLPTSSDDTIIAICPKAHASLVKHAIKSCDTLKQYAVKVQVFEVGDNGKTIPVGGPHLLIGREGTMQCTTPGESVSLNFKVDTPFAEGNSEEPSPTDSETAEIGREPAGSEPAGITCAGVGHCHLDCPPPIGEMSVESACDPSGIVHYGLSFTNGGTDDSESCCESGTCPACKTSSCSGCKAGTSGCSSCQSSSGTCSSCKTSSGTCSSCSGTCSSCKTSRGTCAACKTGSCTADCCKDGCCHGEACSNSGCKCDGSCEGESAQKSHETTNYEETLMEAPTSHSHKQFSIGLSFGVSGPGLHFGGPFIWFNKGDEPRCAACECEHQIADSDDGHDCECGNAVPPSPAPAATPSCQLVDVAGQQSLILFQPAATCGKNGCHGITFDFTQAPGKLVGAKVFNDNAIYIRQTDDPSGSSCTDGRPTLVSAEEGCAPSANAPCSCEETEETQQAPGAEPPALLTLSQHKESSSGVPATPHWQEEMLKTFRGRRLSELFEPQVAQTHPGREFGRLVAEFPKHGAAANGTHNLTIVDMPDRVRIFESSPSVSVVATEKISETVKASIPGTCPSCREEFRAFLEEMFRGPEEIAQTSHQASDRKASEEIRDLPNVTHSKIATEVVRYPLRDLVLCDDAGHPVFDTCSIIDHLQAAVAPETWSHPSVSIQLDQQSVSLVITQTAEVHEKIANHLHYLRRLQIKQICNLIEHLSSDTEDAAESSTQNDTPAPNVDIELGTALPVGH